MNTVLLVISCVLLLIMVIGFSAVADVTSKVIYSYVLRYRTRGFYSALVQPCVWVATVALLGALALPVTLGLLALIL